MAAKILVSYPGSLSTESVESKKKGVADALGVCPEDVILFLGGTTATVIDLPDALTKAREKADKEAADAAAKAKADQEKAELEAIKASTPTPVLPEAHAKAHGGHHNAGK